MKKSAEVTEKEDASVEKSVEPEETIREVVEEKKTEEMNSEDVVVIAESTNNSAACQLNSLFSA